ncbi:TraB/GumN family protein [Erythrobacter sp. THAF29]|uniref:TraB/GumN family protein n=1 Tax=Erythrobacter sp. THAF29 TaxID=2587851 RepID=UPI001268390B|nr:TraB/GumN family protein [Erythrobacter sp. THAF29]QFT77849.1 TraB family protein [Erythrobacter sp. THAF29]
MRFTLALPLIALTAGAPLAATETEVTSAPTELVCEAGSGQKLSDIEAVPPVQDYEPSPAMWKIADEDTTIYLFGTYHVLPEGFRWRTPLFDKVMAEVDEVVFESRDDEEVEPGDLSVDQLRLMLLLREYRSDTPISERLSEQNREKFLRLLDAADIPAARVEHGPPLMAMLAIVMAMIEAEGSQRELGVETIIEAEFKESGRPISAIEDFIQVLENMFNIDEVTMIDALEQGLTEWDGCELFDPADVDWSNEHSWAQGKLDAADLEEMFEDPFGKALYEVLLTDRNRAWTDWVVKRLEQPGNLLLAVGAGHMEGPDSLVTMLEQRGVTSNRIQ